MGGGRGLCGCGVGVESGNFKNDIGMDVRPSNSNPSSFIYLRVDKKAPFIYLTS